LLKASKAANCAKVSECRILGPFAEFALVFFKAYEIFPIKVPPGGRKKEKKKKTKKGIN